MLVHRNVLLALLLFGCGDDADVAAADASAAVRMDAAVARDAAAASLDAGPVDAGHDAAPPWEPPTVELPDPDFDGTFLLSQTSLYVDIVDKVLAPDLIHFEPDHVLWSDAADKQRWLRLPAGETIDTSEMDHWRFPVGAMLFKQFARGDRRLETRLIARLGPGPDDYWMGAFVWEDDESDAVFTPDGAEDVRGTTHDVPSVKNCGTCHRGEPGRILGFSAVQMPDAEPSLLSAPPVAYAVPGDEVTARALGYLHANCAHCHNPTGSARPDTDMNLRLSIDARTPEATNTYISTVDVELQYFEAAPMTRRVLPGDPDLSALVLRMRERGTQTQMPPLATEIVHDDGLQWVRAWIEGL